MEIRIIVLAVITLCAAQTIAHAETIRIAIAANQQSVTLKSETGLVVDGGSAGNEKRVVYSAEVIGSPVRIGSTGEFIQVNGKSYRGTVELRKDKGGKILVVNDLDLESYLLGVVASEIPHDWSAETLKAQAVIARTYALYQKRNRKGKPYHIVATESSQMYGGKSGERPSTTLAVEESRGEVIVYKGEPIAAFYHSSCGGHTEKASQLWDIDKPYLNGVDCACQSISKYGTWERSFQAAEMEKVLNAMGFPIKRISGMKNGLITEAGRVSDIVVSHSRGRVSVPAEKLRAAVGNARIPSVFFEVGLQNDQVVFSGRGMGHGVGLCQWGAEEMARRKFDYISIIEHYYPGTKIVMW